MICMTAPGYFVIGGGCFFFLNRKEDITVGKLFGSHHAIERFGVIFLSLLVCMLLLLVSIFTVKIKADRKLLSGQAIYTGSFSMTLTGDSGSVRGLYVNQDKTKCFVLLQFDSMENMPMDASEYKIYLTGADTDMSKAELMYQPDVSLYVLGNTGYMGVYLYSAEGFPSQILALTLQSQNNYAGASSAHAGNGNSDSQFNQARIFINPGGEFATHGTFLDSKNFDIRSAYVEMITRSSEVAVRTDLRNSLIAMRDQQLLMQEYEARLLKSDILLPDVPKEIADDVIYAICPEDENEVKLVWDSQYSVWVDPDDESKQYNDDQVNLYLDTKYVVPGGYSFDWQTSSIEDGILKKLTGSDSLTDWDDYFDKVSQSAIDAEDEFNVDVEWYYTSGRVFNNVGSDTDSGLSSRQTDIAQSIKKLTDAWSTYYSLKTEYQKTQLLNLLHIESTLADVLDMYSVNMNENADLLYYY